MSERRAERVGDVPGMSEAIDAVGNAQNQHRLYLDVRAFVRDGTAPDDLPEGRSYNWPNPSCLPESVPSYKRKLRNVLRVAYDHEKGCYPDEIVEEGL